ncbi:DUF4932 domain-containing protein [Gramella jeungdoensis]|uniref:DUF4932 domain-containing protein n=1 Tax=Gramella jeungdoensis TaxID=708091 RepID=A0ABT0YYQ2_9FLAO|nr:DUF4932 domain-containing protein [Gramella jeungdoensis]MCM8568592.1 DUF4932 domain-containing protein [Gramella jeungdoensis]
MKKFTILLLSFYTSFTFGQGMSTIKKPEIDKRVELLSIAFRLAESEEYTSEVFKLYTDKINNHYTAYKDHELIGFIKKLRQENGVSYDAVMKMAVHLDQNLEPLVEFNETIPEPRWGKENAYKFVGLLQDFYHYSNSEQFFKANSALYAEASGRFIPIYNKLDIEWYKDFYGKEPNEEFIIVNGLGNGGGNYGPSVELPNGKKEVYAIMGAWNTDAEGMVEFPVNNYFPTLLHEFNHSFVNELLDKNNAKFRDSGEIIYDVVKKEMRSGAYGNWQTMINEALVRAAVIKYMKDHSFPEDQISLEISEQLNRGFIWIEDLVTELENYDNNRGQYPTLESFTPQLARAYKSYAENIHEYIEASKKVQPHFVSISEFKNGSKEVDPALKQISLNFDKAFSGANFIRPGEDKEAFPNFTNLRFSEDRKTVILEWNLEDDKDYEFFLIGISPKTETATEDYAIRFSTK